MFPSITKSAAALCAVGLSMAACSGSGGAAHTDGGPPPGPLSGSVGADLALAVPCKDAVSAIYGDPGALTAGAGTILKCALDHKLTRDDVQAALDKNGYKGDPVTSGATIYRIVYRTERATLPPSPGYSSAYVAIPDNPRGKKLPAISISHGVRGQAPACAMSLLDPAGAGNTEGAMALEAAGSGFPVVASDYAGFSNYGAPGNPPSGMAYSADVARSTLDSIRALRKLLPGLVDERAVFVGHSQGGHTTLSTVALAASYAPDVVVAGAVTHSPLWFNQASWGAIFLLDAQYPLATDTFPSAVGLWYLYSHGAIMDGMDHALDPFLPSKRDAVKQFFDGNCDETMYATIQAAAKVPSDLYDPDFVAGVTNSAAFGEAAAPCSAVANPKQRAFCEKWIPRYAADRPHLTGAAAKVPLLVTYGLKDTTIPPDRAKCGTDRLRADRANLTVCVDKNATHGTIPTVRGGYAMKWIEHNVLGEPASAETCDGDDSAIVDGTGKPVTCATPPPND